MTIYSAIFSFLKLLLNVTLFFFIFIHLSGCTKYKVCTETFLSSVTISSSSTEKQIQRYEGQKLALQHPLYQVIPRHRCQIKWYDAGHWITWMVFGNDDEGIFGEGPNTPYQLNCRNDAKKAVYWWCRNPLHNFTHYIIGNAHQVNSELTLLNINGSGVSFCHYEPVAKKNFGSERSSFFVALHGWKPFISFRLVYPFGKCTEVYFGWRKRGCFGIKLNLLTKDKNLTNR